MARNARTGHRFQATPIHVDHQVSYTGTRIKRVKFCKIRATIRSGRHFDCIRTLVLPWVFYDGRVEVDAGIGIAGRSLDKIIFHVRHDGAVGILSKGQIATVTQITNITNNDVNLGSGVATKTVCRFPFIERVFLVIWVDSGVIGLRPHR